MAGRKPLGPELVQHLAGSEHAKERLAMILATLAGRCSIAEACEQLGIGEAMFHRLRSAVLQAGLDRLEPRPLGRPPHETSAEAQRIAELEARLTEVEHARQTAEVRLEVAQVLAAPGAEDVVKKTMAHKQRRRQRLRASRKKKSP
jgi:transposase